MLELPQIIEPVQFETITGTVGKNHIEADIHICTINLTNGFEINTVIPGDVKYPEQEARKISLDKLATLHEYINYINDKDNINE